MPFCLPTSKWLDPWFTEIKIPWFKEIKSQVLRSNIAVYQCMVFMKIWNWILYGIICDKKRTDFSTFVAIFWYHLIKKPLRYLYNKSVIIMDCKPATSLERDFSTGLYYWILWNFSEQFFCSTSYSFCLSCYFNCVFYGYRKFFFDKIIKK